MAYTLIYTGQFKKDLKLFKELAKKMGWTITDKKSGIEKAMEKGISILPLSY